MSVKAMRDVQASPVSAGEKTTIQVLIPPGEGPNFAMRRFAMQPGGGMPLHTNEVEHEQYVLSGRARIRIGSDEFEVKPGDVVFIPAGVPHSYQNIGEDEFAFLCMVPNQEDQIKLVGADNC